MINRKIYNNGSLVITVCRDRVTADELIASANWMVSNFGNAIKPGFKQLLDAMDADTSAITEEDIHRIAQINLSHARSRGEFPMAILATRPYPLALARLHKLLSAAAEIKVEIFGDAEAAYKWLRVDEPKT